MKRSICQYGNIYTNHLKTVKNFTDLNASRVYGVLLGNIYLFCVMYDKIELWSAYIIAYLPQINVKFKSNFVSITAHRIKSPCYTANTWKITQCLKSIDKHILLLEYPSPSFHTREILLAFLYHNQDISAFHLVVLVLQMRNSLGVSAPGHYPRILDWTCYLRTPLCHIYIPY